MSGAAENETIVNNIKDQAENPSHKATYLEGYQEPDLTIVVGGKVYKEYSATLSCWSQYFCAALKSGMKESQTMTFEFPHEDPAEWEWIMALTAPLPSVTVTAQNVDTALFWFDRLGSNRGLATCDHVICNETVAGLLPEEETSKKWTDLKPEEIEAMRHSLDKLLEALGTGVQYRLGITKAACFEIIKRVCSNLPYLFQLEQLKKTVSFLRDDEETRNALWYSFQQHLPQSIADQSSEELARNSLLPELFHSEISHKGKELQMEGQMRGQKKGLEEQMRCQQKEAQDLQADMQAFIKFMASTIASNSQLCDIRKKIKQDPRRYKYLGLFRNF